MREVRSIMDARSDPDPLKTVLYQECDRYNALLSTLHRALRDLELAAQGLVVVTPELEVCLQHIEFANCEPSLSRHVCGLFFVQHPCTHTQTL